MARCRRMDDLVVAHLRADGPNLNKLPNARVLCPKCLREAISQGLPDPGKGALPEFSEFVKTMALQRAEQTCECISFSGCH